MAYWGLGPVGAGCDPEIGKRRTVIGDDDVHVLEEWRGKALGWQRAIMLGKKKWKDHSEYEWNGMAWVATGVSTPGWTNTPRRGELEGSRDRHAHDACVADAKSAQDLMAEGLRWAHQRSDAVPDENPKTAYGITKPSMAVVPPSALLPLMAAMDNGAKKYGAFNWRKDAVSSTIYYAAAMRHLMAWLDGEEAASDSGVHHLGHVMACCAIILDAQAVGKLNDNRPSRGEFSRLCAEMTKPLTTEKS
jgi:Domain of unknown function (DUF5664)